MPIHWRSPLDIAEENRHGKQYDPNRVTAVMTLQCLDCGGEITEIHYADGRRSYDTYGVRNVLGEGVRHAHCLRDEDLRHDVDAERDGNDRT
jgi:hypothetical protein